MSIYRPKPRSAIGNLSLLMASHAAISILKNERFYFHEDIKNYGRGFMLSFPPTVKEDVPINNGNGIVNAFMHFENKSLGDIMRMCIRPSKLLIENYIDPYYDQIKDCKTAFHIRMGRNAEDSYKFAHYGTANDVAVNAMIEEAKKLDEPVFVLSDSESTKKYFKENVPKAKCLDIKIGFTADEHSQNQSVNNEEFESKMNSMAEWFILSKMKKIYTTMGGPGCGSSTFGFSAAIYGDVIPHYVYNNGRINHTTGPVTMENKDLYRWFEA